MTLSGRLAWELTRLAARSGAMHLLPPRSGSPFVDRVRHLIRPGWAAAISVAADERRAIVLLIDEHGTPQFAAKVATDAAGSRSIAVEAEQMEHLTPFLATPLSAPRVIERGDGILVLSAVRWLPRWRPWYLTASLAAAIGRFHGTAHGTSRAPGHGDFAPWNVMRTSTGWAVLDWEDASVSAPHYADPFHFLVQGHALLGRPRAEELLVGLDGRGWVGRALRAYASAAGLTHVLPRDAMVGYLEQSMPSRGDRPDHVRGRRARSALLRHLAAGR